MMPLIANMTCGVLLVLNVSKLKWNAHDTEVLKRNKAFCEKHYKELKCMKRFVKVGDQSYYITCERERSELR